MYRGILEWKGGRNVMHITPHCLVPGLRLGGAKNLWRAQGQIYL